MSHQFNHIQYGTSHSICSFRPISLVFVIAAAVAHPQIAPLPQIEPPSLAALNATINTMIENIRNFVENARGST